MDFIDPQIVFKSEHNMPDGESLFSEPGEAVSYARILDFNSDKKMILIEGKPGIGKSTLVRKMCKEFAERKFANEFSLVLRVVVRGLPSTPYLHLQDLVRSAACGTDIKVDEGSVTEITKYIKGRNGNGVLLIFDGLNEIPENAKQSVLIKEILHGNQLPGASLIITSTPQERWALHSAVNLHLEMLGFQDKHVDLYVSKYFMDPEKNQNMLSELSKQHRIRSICNIPQILQAACFVFQEEGKIPLTATRLFLSLVCLSVKSFFKDRGQQVDCNDLSDICKLCPNFTKLCNQALDGVLQGKTVFENLDLPNADYLGLVDLTSSKSAQGDSKATFSFLHPMFQAFLAACSIKILSEAEQLQFWLKHFLFRFSKSGSFQLTDGSCKLVFLFFCGLGVMGEKLDQLVMEPLEFMPESVISEKTPFLQLCSIVSKAGNADLCQRILSFCGPTIEVKIEGKGHVSDIAWCVNQHKGIKVLKLPLPMESVGIFVKQLPAISCLESAEFADLFCETSEDIDSKYVPYICYYFVFFENML